MYVTPLTLFAETFDGTAAPIIKRNRRKKDSTDKIEVEDNNKTESGREKILAVLAFDVGRVKTENV